MSFLKSKIRIVMKIVYQFSAITWIRNSSRRFVSDSIETHFSFFGFGFFFNEKQFESVDEMAKPGESL